MIPGENIEKLQKKCTCKLLILIIVVYKKFNNTISIKNGSRSPIVGTDRTQSQQKDNFLLSFKLHRSFVKLDPDPH